MEDNEGSLRSYMKHYRSIILKIIMITATSIQSINQSFNQLIKKSINQPSL